MVKREIDNGDENRKRKAGAEEQGRIQGGLCLQKTPF